MERVIKITLLKKGFKSKYAYSYDKGQILVNKKKYLSSYLNQI